jgi:hypothetical protein
MWAIFVITQKTAQTKHSPNGRKFAQSGHTGRGPACDAHCLLWPPVDVLV